MNDGMSDALTLMGQRFGGSSVQSKIISTLAVFQTQPISEHHRMSRDFSQSITFIYSNEDKVHAWSVRSLNNTDFVVVIQGKSIMLSKAAFI